MTNRHHRANIRDSSPNRDVIFTSTSNSERVLEICSNSLGTFIDREQHQRGRPGTAARADVRRNPARRGPLPPPPPPPRRGSASLQPHGVTAGVLNLENLGSPEDYQRALIAFEADYNGWRNPVKCERIYGCLVHGKFASHSTSECRVIRAVRDVYEDRIRTERFVNAQYPLFRDSSRSPPRRRAC